MKFLFDFVPLGILAATAVSSFPVTQRDVNEALVPPFGFSSGLNPTGTGDCDGAVKGSNGQPIKIPCDCPPDRATFIKILNANVAAGHVLNNPSVPISFPEDNSKASQLARLNAASVTLQNLNGSGKGCPIVSTTFQAQAAAINAGSQPAPLASPSVPSPSLTPTINNASTHPASSASSSVSPTSLAPATKNAGSPTSLSATPSASSSSLTLAQIEALAPQLGFSAGKNPTGTGNCDGAINGADGKPIQVPCACPPDQTTFDQHLLADVLAGHAVNNPTVKVTFPTDNTVASQLARVDTALVTLQNLNGPGKGCPAVSTTLATQQAALLKQL
jgi:Fe-S cluster biogenesis protein NfuA